MHGKFCIYHAHIQFVICVMKLVVVLLLLQVYIKNLRAISFNRLQDIRATEIDKVDMHLSFRPGDIVRAIVVSFKCECLC